MGPEKLLLAPTVHLNVLKDHGNKLNTDTVKLAEVMKQMDLTDTICKTHQTQEEGRPKCDYFVPS